MTTQLGRRTFGTVPYVKIHSATKISIVKRVQRETVVLLLYQSGYRSGPSISSKSGSGSMFLMTIERKIELKESIFFIKIAIYLSLGLNKKTSKLQGKPSAH
jgi:hypothetical protein